MDKQVRAVRLGWLPFYPQFDRSPLDVVREAGPAGAGTDAEIVALGGRAAQGRRSCKFAVEDPDAPENWPRSGSSGAATP